MTQDSRPPGSPLPTFQAATATYGYERKRLDETSKAYVSARVHGDESDRRQAWADLKASVA